MSKNIKRRFQRLTEKRESQEVHLVYKRSRREVLFPIIIGLILIGYVFFFTGNIWIPLSMDTEETAFDQEIAFGAESKRTVTLYDWEYCKETQMMEIKLRFFNGEFDGVNDYVYDIGLRRGSKSDVKIQTVLNEQLLTVLQVGPVKEGFQYMTLYFAPDYERAITRQDMGSISLLEKDIREVEKIDIKTREEYLIDRLDLVIAKKNEENDEIREEIKGNEKMIRNIKKANEIIDVDKSFQTEEEIALSNEEKRQNEAKISELKRLNGDLDVQLQQNEIEIRSARETKETISKEKGETLSIRFQDVSESDWFYEDVQYVVKRKIMSGTSENTFSPKQETTRAQIVTMLWRMDGECDEGDNAGFYVDVKEGAYYEKAAIWAARNRITSGTGDQTFSPNKPITREELTLMLMRYARYQGKDTSQRAELNEYQDIEEADSWAVEALSWAQASGYISGMTKTKIAPKDKASRVQVAVILHRILM